MIFIKIIKTGVTVKNFSCLGNGSFFINGVAAEKRNRIMEALNNKNNIGHGVQIRSLFFRIRTRFSISVETVKKARVTRK